ERPPDRDHRAAVASGQLTLGGQAIAVLQVTGVERGLQVQVDLVVQRHGTELEPVLGHPSSETSVGGFGVGFGLRTDNVITNLADVPATVKRSSMGLKVAVVGGGSTYTPELIEGFVTRADRLPDDELAPLVIDLDPLPLVRGRP